MRRAKLRSFRLAIHARWLHVTLCASLFIAVSGVPVLAADASKAGESVASAIDELAAKRKDLAAQVDTLTKQAKAAGGDSTTPDVSASEDELEFLDSLDAIYAQQQARLEQRQELEAEKKQADDELASFRKTGPTEAKPYSFLLLENLRDELAAEEDREAASKADLKAAGQQLEAAKTHFDQAEKDRRRTQEALTRNLNKQRAAALAAELESAKRQSQLDKEMISMRRFELDARTLRRDICTAHKTQLSEKVDQLGKSVQFTKQDLADRLKDPVGLRRRARSQAQGSARPLPANAVAAGRGHQAIARPARRAADDRPGR